MTDNVIRLRPLDADDDAALPPAFTEESLALRFAETHANELRYVAVWGKWYIWTGTQWREDNTLKVFDHARKICRAASAECNRQNLASRIASRQTVAAIVSLARADRRLAATVEQWDTDPWLLNTEDGTIDLHTGAKRAHNPGDYITKSTAAAPGGACPLFLRFLDEITDGDKELQLFMQRVFGYSLTGSTREHALFFGYGTGRNGKSVLIDTVSGIANDYHTVAPIETFTAAGHERHPTDLAGLRGARLVTAIETEEGRRWAESRIKALTGGDKISARFMRQDFFQYKPQFKLVIAGNHKPSLRSVDEAIRSRFNLIPFLVTIPIEERDLQLGEKLKAEWSGILQWMIDGCVAWQEVGLAPPKSVTEATSAYLESEDGLAAWMEEACERDPGAFETSSDLFASWKAWAERSGEVPGALKAFRQSLEKRGLHESRQHSKRGFVGLRLSRADTSEAYWNK